MADMIVAGAGTTAVNGTYVESGTANGKPKYTFGSYTIEWYAEESFPPGSYTYFWLLGGFYKSFSNVATPDLCTTWSAYWGAGQSPMPTVTAAGGGDPSSSIINHVMHYRRLMSR